MYILCLICQICNTDQSQAPGSAERKALEEAIARMKSQGVQDVPLVIAGKQVKSGNVLEQIMPHDHKQVLCKYYGAEESQVSEAIEAAMAARESWATLAWADRAAIFLKAADLLTKKYRYEVMAATMLGQGKNVRLLYIIITQTDGKGMASRNRCSS